MTAKVPAWTGPTQPPPPPPPGGVRPCGDGCEMATRCQHFGLCRLAAALERGTDGRRL